ncbi:hypothetical protein BJF85_17965 [Saccharomonospora sp. CUA-673]|nr:hypothetical protein BJF85_17965 [Saccharomonospora sp. CUA-673]
MARQESSFSHDVAVGHRAQDLFLAIGGCVADLELSAVHDQQTRHRVSGAVDHLALLDAQRTDKLGDVQLLVVGESLEDRHASDTQVVLGHGASLPEPASTAP